MPLNASLMRAQITRFADHSSTLLRERITRRDALMAPLMPDYASADMLLAATLLAAAGTGKAHWTSACFSIDEPVNGQFEHGREPARYALIASDGSQIMPDRHKPVLFAYIQAACACIVYGAGDDPAARAAAEAVKQDRPCEMLTEDALDVSETANPAAEVSNRRDLLEIELLARACERMRAAGVQPIVVADGSLVPFALLNDRVLSNATQTNRLLRPLIAALDRMRAAGALVAGYIDRPNSNAVARTCALDGLLPDAVSAATLAAREGRAEGIYDRHLYEHTLPAGRRSALFDPGWGVNANKHLGAAGHAMRACYANMGGPLPIIARLEFPAWCAGPADVGAVSAVLQRHAAINPDGYPFILKAAHEEAVVTKEDQREVETALEQALLERGIQPRTSPKQSAKDSR